MKTVILDGSTAQDTLATRIKIALLNQLGAQNHQTQTYTLREHKIGNCAGDFFCWVRSPGQCNIADDNREIAAAIATADLLIYLTPITFGGYSATLKKAVDHQIQNIAPFFTTLNGETHHAKRYRRYADFLAIGWQPQPNPAAENIFRHLVWRNSLNFYSQASHCEILTGDPETATLASQIDSALAAIARRESAPKCGLPTPKITAAPSSAPKHALLLVGSPRTRKSTSHALGTYLMQQLSTHGITTETAQIYTALNNPQKMRDLLTQIDTADLTVLAFPLYVDSLPAPDLLFLERLAAHRAAQPAAQKSFAVLANCGFPEAHHTANALAVCNQFAEQTNLMWMGSLALGAGEGLVHGTPLNEMDGRAIPLRNALNLAAQALAQGQPIPTQAQDLISKPFIPVWMYRLMGGIGWRMQAKRWGAQNNLKKQPYTESV